MVHRTNKTVLLFVVLILSACTGRVPGESHSAWLAHIGDPDLQAMLTTPVRHEELLQADGLIAALHGALEKDIITGYDLRLAGVYDGFPRDCCFIYSQSSLPHMRELVSLLDDYDIPAGLYLTPKISAFLFRDDWGEPSEAVSTLANGKRIVDGREFAALFYFEQPEDRQRFRAVIDRHAKKDSADEAGLIADAWWQPFYYTDGSLAEFKPISLVIVTGEKYEATLTVTEERTAEVVSAFDKGPWPVRVDRVWVNPAFFRFLHGDYR